MKLEIIPAMDIINNKLVRLKQGSFSETTFYPFTPLDLAKEFEQIGIKRLHLVDLEGAKAGKFVHLDLLENLAKQTALKIDFSGGVRSLADAQQVLNSGASYVTIGSMAIQAKEKVEEIINLLGADKIIISADFIDKLVYTNAWLAQSNILINDLITSYTKLGIRQFLCTSIKNDGMLSGLNITAYQDILKQNLNLFLIASGGLSSLEDLDLLRKNNIPAVVLGKAFYDGKISLKNLEQFISGKI